MKKASTHQHARRNDAQPHVDLVEQLRVRGLKATEQRLALLSVLACGTTPLALHEIQERVQKGIANQSTLYRVVRDLVKAGLVRSVDFRHTHAHYELATGNEHHHLICTTCGTVEEFVAQQCTELERAALKESTLFASVTDHAFELYGICRRCAQAPHHR